ncbi:MAG: hypothetical protein ACYCU8_00230 [Ferrimicrobium acidiphilum]
MSREADSQVIFDTDASVRRFADIARLSAYQRDVLVVASKQPWETRIIAMRSLLRYGYGVGNKLNPKATLQSMYELHNGTGASSGMSLETMLRELDRQLIEVPVKASLRMSTGIDQSIYFMNQYIAKTGWLSTMLNAANARWAHAKNLRLTEALMELWSAIVAISDYGFDKAITSGQGIHLKAVPNTYSGWEVQNRPKRIPAHLDSILAIPSRGVVTMVTPDAPSITDDDRVLLHLSPAPVKVQNAAGSKNIYNMIGCMASIPRLEDVDYLLLSSPYLPSVFRVAKKELDPAGSIDVPPRIKVLQAARGAA